MARSSPLDFPSLNFKHFLESGSVFKRLSEVRLAFYLCVGRCEGGHAGTKKNLLDDAEEPRSAQSLIEESRNRKIYV